ncbi:glycosyltransferase [Neopusillimonas maritima]|uniref:Glycosyltransferase subfamily 4-like N-terminal domain-containing protein n=1 Tax=Neopusillimonas maritima TaxID=2026239 RepID=A0ABX9MWQ0_9BURK|nr:glycosyltransferase [Neopusillimonas maritima]RII83395.1 hypothetical protein CJO09_07295 [Neopusillimonas maritima]
MLTDDVQIDRRILLEAESLISQGNEVILLAMSGSGDRAFETIGNVKVERVSGSELPYSERVILKVFNFYFKFIAFAFSFVNAASQIIANRFSSKIGRILFFLSRKTNSVFVLLGYKLQTASILLHKRLRKLSTHERFILQRALFYRPDAIHAHDLPQLKVAAYASNKLKIPLVYDAHELYPEIASLLPDQKRKLASLERKYIKRANAVITVNSYIAEEMRRRYKIAKPTVILNATNRPEYFDNSHKYDLFRNELNIKSHNKIILFQGWMSKQRGLQNLVRALAAMPNEIVLVFMGYGEAKPELLEIAIDLGCVDRVYFKDAVPQAELLYWTASADVGVIPYQAIDLNNYFCSPNKLFEFIQASLPILANDLPYLREVVFGEGFGVVSSLDSPEEYSESLLTLLDESCYQECKEQLLLKREKYSWLEQEHTLFKVYDSLTHRT